MPVCPRVTKIHPASFTSSINAGSDTEQETNSLVSDGWDLGLLHSPSDPLLIALHIKPLIETAAKLLKPKETSKNSGIGASLQTKYFVLENMSREKVDTAIFRAQANALFWCLGR